MNQPPDIGALLRDTRSRFGWSLEDVAHRTRIPVANLRHLEANDYTKFPSRSYAKSFLAQYSEHLGIDPLEWLDQFEAQDAFADLERREVQFLDEHDEHPDAAPLVLKRKRPAPNALAVRTESRPDDSPRLPRSAAVQPMLVFTITAALVTAAVFGFMKLSENVAGIAAETAPDEAREERLRPVSTLNSGRPELRDFSSVPRARPVSSDDHLVAGHPTTTGGGSETAHATPSMQEVTSTDFIFDSPPPRAVIVEE